MTAGSGWNEVSFNSQRFGAFTVPASPPQQRHKAGAKTTRRVQSEGQILRCQMLGERHWLMFSPRVLEAEVRGRGQKGEAGGAVREPTVALCCLCS